MMSQQYQPKNKQQHKKLDHKNRQSDLAKEKQKKNGKNSNTAAQ